MPLLLLLLLLLFLSRTLQVLAAGTVPAGKIRAARQRLRSLASHAQTRGRAPACLWDPAVSKSARSPMTNSLLASHLVSADANVTDRPRM